MGDVHEDECEQLARHEALSGCWLRLRYWHRRDCDYHFANDLEFTRAGGPGFKLRDVFKSTLCWSSVVAGMAWALLSAGTLVLTAVAIVVDRNAVLVFGEVLVFVAAFSLARELYYQTASIRVEIWIWLLGILAVGMFVEVISMPIEVALLDGMLALSVAPFAAAAYFFYRGGREEPSRGRRLHTGLLSLMAGAAVVFAADIYYAATAGSMGLRVGSALTAIGALAVIPLLWRLATLRVDLRDAWARNGVTDRPGVASTTTCIRVAILGPRPCSCSALASS